MYAGELSSVGCTPYDGLYREAPCVRDIFFIHQVYESVGKVLVYEVFGMVFGAWNGFWGRRGCYRNIMLHGRLIYPLNCLTKVFVIHCFVSTAYCWSGDGVK